jgi:ribosomal protein S18 acetylase RimI-like enzyme
LVPEVRGRGWGAAFTELALWLGRQAAAERVVLAVDSANEPAIRMYQSLGFFEFARRAVWIRQLPRIPNVL